MNRETAFVTTVAGILLLLPMLLQTGNELTTSLIVTVALLAAIVIADRRLNRAQQVALQYAPIESSARGQ